MNEKDRSGRRGCDVCCGIIVAAGRGSRMGMKTPKQLLPYGGSTVLECAAVPFLRSGLVDSLVIVIPAGRPDYQKYEGIRSSLEERYGRKVVLTEGGPERGDSVKNGLKAVRAAYPEVPANRIFVLIHDAARPGVSEAVIKRNIEMLEDHDAVCTAIPSIDSVRMAKGDDSLNLLLKYPIMGTRAVDRRLVYNIQTPQSFRLSSITEAYRQAEDDGFTGTDDASVAEHGGLEVVLCEGERANSKITVESDLPMSVRTGTGFDVHRLVPGRKLILCGAPVPSEKGLLGHSDADVAAHALMDAILGAAGKGDIGRHFPDNDDRYLGADSMELLKETMNIVGDVTVCNVDITIIAERPKLAPYIDTMKKNIAKTLGISETAVNVKATTTEGLGFTGRGEGIAAMAACTLEGRF